MHNKSIIIGRLGAEPIFREINETSKVCNFNVAVNDGFGDKKVTTWFRVAVWGKQAEACKNYLVKGSLVLVEGPVKVNEYNGKANLEINARDIKFLSPIKNEVQTQGDQTTLTISTPPSDTNFLDDGIPF